ncbi:TadE/TadG family type IV pilus assembly protein [Pelodictyon luteolum]|nr:TadE family protein [Pelodictyon luteolum]
MRPTPTLPFPKARCIRSRKGSVLVEFALILPVFLALLFGVVSFSAALYNKTVLTMATREGARAGVLFVPDRTDAIIRSSATLAADRVCQNNLISFGAPVSAAVSTNSTPTLDNILTVSATVDFTGIFIVPDLVISSQTTMRLE